jgi:TRAF3-interacting protein 1
MAEGGGEPGPPTKLKKQIFVIQELLGKHFKKPPLLEKNLTRPPFRFLHDVFIAVRLFI